jgi:hypothetical protein
MALRPPTMGSFKPGQSGNPAGRPNDAEVVALARRYTADAIRALVEVCRYGKGSERVSAATTLLDRGWGKPKQELEVGGLAEAVHLHLYAVQRMEAVQVVAADVGGAPIEGVADDYLAELLPRIDDRLPHEALPLWDAAARPEGANPNPEDE